MCIVQESEAEQVPQLCLLVTFRVHVVVGLWEQIPAPRPLEQQGDCFNLRLRSAPRENCPGRHAGSAKRRLRSSLSRVLARPGIQF